MIKEEWKGREVGRGLAGLCVRVQGSASFYT